MPNLKQRLERITGGESSNHPLVQDYLSDKNAQHVANMLKRLTERQGKPARLPPSRSLPMLD